VSKHLGLFGLVPLVFVFPAWSNPDPEHIEVRHGAVIEQEQAVGVEGGFTTVLQSADDKAIDDELLASFDLVTTFPAAGGKWVVYVEGNTSPRNQGVSALLGEANADAGSALDREGNGRLQISELHYFHSLGEGLLVSGLVDVTGTLDTSEVANNETLQFLSSALVNNPTIDFPDYSLGIVYNREFSKERGYSLAVTSSHGLADNPDASYAQLVDIGASGKGVFVAAEGLWPVASSNLHAGVWWNTADHARLDGQLGTEQNYGLYLVVDGHLGSSLLNVRVGLANDKVSQAAKFLSAALERRLSKATLGLGLALTGLSNEDVIPNQDDMLQAEVYLRLEPRVDLSITPAMQWLNNSGFDGSGLPLDSDQILFSLRLNFTF